jgi:hypothetical protein
MRENLVDREDVRALGPGCVARPVGGAIVDDHDLVDQRESLDERPPHGRDDATDRRFLVSRRQAHRHGVPVAGLGLDQCRQEPRLPGSAHALSLRTA